MRGPIRPVPLLAAAAVILGSTGCAVRPGYVDAATGRAYAGYAKPAFYCSDLCGLKECDCGRHPYTPPVAAFTSFPGLAAGFHNGVPPANTTRVYAPPPARYEDFQGNPALNGPPRPRGRRRSEPPRRGMDMNGVPPAPAPAPMPLPVTDGPLDGSLDAPFGPLETSPEGIGQ